MMFGGNATGIASIAGRQALGRMATRYAIAIALSVIAALVIAGVQGVPPADLELVLDQALFTRLGLLDGLRAATPEVLGGIAFAIGARAGIFNIGLAGQYYWGGFAASVVGIYMPGPSFVVIPAAIAAACLAGAFWAWPAAILKQRFGINELVTTLMGNYIAVLLISLIVKTWFLGPGYVVASLPIRPEAEIAPLAPGLSDANWSFLLAILVPALFALVLARTGFGFGLRAISAGGGFARYSGVDVARTQLAAFLLSGAVAGMVGAAEVLGVLHRYVTGFADDIALDGLVVAILGGGTPLGVLVVGFFLGVLRNIGFVLAQFTDMSSYVITLIFAIFVLAYISDPVGYLQAKWRGGWWRMSGR